MHQVKRQGWAAKLSCLEYDWVGNSTARLLTNDSPAGSLGWRVVAFHLIIGQHITNSQVFGKALVGGWPTCTFAGQPFDGHQHSIFTSIAKCISND